MNSTFFGWVPTITGNLSFATIGVGRTPQKAFKLFRSFPDCRYTIIAQKRNKSDSIFRSIVDPFRQKRGDHYFIFLGRCYKDENWQRMSGPVFIVSPEAYEIAALYLRSISDQDDETSVSSWTERLAVRLSSLIGTAHCFVAAARLERTGKLEVSINSTIYSQSDIEVISSQTYYFLRDACHVHQHHSRTSDTILEIYLQDPEEIVWKRETLYALFRWIIQRKRERSSFSYARSKGVLAYAEAFRKLHVGSTSSADIPNYLVEEVRQSLDAGIESSTLVSSARSGIKSAFVAIVFSFLAFFVGLSALFRDMYDSKVRDQIARSTEVESFQSFLVLVASHPWQATGVAIFTMVSVSLPLSFRSVLRGNSFFLDLLRLLYGLNYWVSFIAVLATLGFSIWVGIQITGALAL